MARSRFVGAIVDGRWRCGPFEGMIVGSAGRVH